MNYLSKLLAFISQIPMNNINDTDLGVVLYKGCKEALDNGLIESEDKAQAFTYSYDTGDNKGYAIVEQSLIDNLVNEVRELKGDLHLTEVLKDSYYADFLRETALKEEYQRKARELKAENEDLKEQLDPETCDPASPLASCNS